MSGENRTDIQKEIDKKPIKKITDAETAMKDMTPAQKEQLEKLKVIYEEKTAKIKYKLNLRNRELQKKKAKKDRAKKVAKKQRKINRKKK